MEFFYKRSDIYYSLSPRRVNSSLPSSRILTKSSRARCHTHTHTHTHTQATDAHFCLVFYEIKGGKVPINKERYRGILKGGGDIQSPPHVIAQQRGRGGRERENLLLDNYRARARERERESEREREVLLTIKK